jgi:hypothetical protein
VSTIGWYYLHKNGELIYKRELGGTVADLRDSDLVRAFWPVDPEDRAGAWRLLVEAMALGATPARVEELATKWGCDDTDGAIYAAQIGVLVDRDGNKWCATGAGFINLAESPAGFGDTYLAALADLAKELGFKPSKMWGATFHDLVKNPRAKS